MQSYILFTDLLLTSFKPSSSNRQIVPGASERVQPPLGAGMLPQAQPEPSCLSWDLAGGLVAVMSQMWHWELWGFSTAV